MTTDLTLVDAVPTYTREQLDIIKRTLVDKLDDNEFALFIEVAKRSGLDPFQRQIYAIKRGEKVTIQTGIDGYRLMAARTGALAGIDDALFDTEDAEHPGKATVTVWRWVHGERVPFTASARWSEYKPLPPNDRMWGKMPFTMLAKCAEALALRKGFPAEISGVYTAEEMAQAEEQAPVAGPARREPTSNLTRQWNKLQRRCFELGLYRSVEEWEDIIADVTEKSANYLDLSLDDYRKVEAHFTALATEKAAAQPKGA